MSYDGSEVEDSMVEIVNVRGRKGASYGRDWMQAVCNVTLRLPSSEAPDESDIDAEVVAELVLTNVQMYNGNGGSSNRGTSRSGSRSSYKGSNRSGSSSASPRRAVGQGTSAHVRASGCIREHHGETIEANSLSKKLVNL